MSHLYKKKGGKVGFLAFQLLSKPEAAPVHCLFNFSEHILYQRELPLCIDLVLYEKVDVDTVNMLLRLACW